MLNGYLKSSPDDTEPLFALLFPVFCVIGLIMCHSLNAIGQQTYILGHKSSIYATVEMKSQACQPESCTERDQTIDFRAKPILPQPAALRTEIIPMGMVQ
ncbi:hypothetical protein ATANTOWER_025121 [Ataeniobius toweri]|uniref:Uncharacterized protein n=1 Tax=Ataeniobius toweri TaxID=208326 RepID=A0ABU7BLT9_9TELE|nr:hypothetical protein [Ataeniobius toweri]